MIEEVNLPLSLYDNLLERFSSWFQEFKSMDVKLGKLTANLKVDQIIPFKFLK